MSFAFKSSRQCLRTVGFNSVLLCGVLVFWNVLGAVWTRADYQILDFFYQYAARFGRTAQASERIVYLTINDQTYQTFGKNTLDRGYLARLNRILAEFAPQAVAYDIIFVHPSDPAADQQFAQSIDDLGGVYLPIGCTVSLDNANFKWEAGAAYQRLHTDYLKQPLEKGTSQPWYATGVIMQTQEFSKAAYNSGHITALPDSDGIYRHQIMLLNIDGRYLPGLSLSLFLDDIGVSLEQIIVDWGREIRIPAAQSHDLDQDVVIPIDAHGQTFIPFPERWGKDFSHITAQDVVKYAQDSNLQGNLESFFSGKFVLIADISQGVPDIGQTPLDDAVPLLAIHSALLNGLLTKTFYQPWSFMPTLLVICIMAGLLTLACLPKSLWPFYFSGSLSMISILFLAWREFTRFSLFPVVSVGSSVLVIFSGYLIGLEVCAEREKAFIHDAFARYIPTKVVEELIRHPEKLRLGGEESIISVLFSDIQGFTTLAEDMMPTRLVRLLNDYFSEMTEIILAEGGIIDKYIGDAIMAEFGMPLQQVDHADRAVSAALKMQRRLHELHILWEQEGFPEIKCRIGINTGKAIVGNMGSYRVFDYTVIGDTINLASRLEGANKRYNTFLMISEATHNALTPDRFYTRILDIIKVKGKSHGVKVFEVYGDAKDNIAPETLAYYQTYQAGIEAYLARDFTHALTLFAAALQARPEDPAAKWLISRIVALNPYLLPADWDGSVILDLK